MKDRLSLWLSEEEQKEIEKFRKEAEKQSRSLGSYIKLKIFHKEK